MDPWEIYLLVKKSMEIDLKGYNLPVEGEFGWSFGSLTKNFEAFVDNSPEKYKKLFLNSSYFSREEEPASEVHEDIEEVVTVPEVSEPVNSDPISLVESDFQLPAFVVYLGADDTLSSSFVLSLSDYKADSGFCLYFVVSKKETFKLPYFVRGEVKTLLDTLPGKYDLLHD
jgi:hypothetical protein